MAVCRFAASGKCRYGNDCRFEHPAGEARGKVCYQFAESGTCRYGDACRYEHARPASRKKSKAQSRTGRGSGKGKRKSGPVKTFFEAYPSFDYRPNASSSKEFHRLCGHYHWDRDDPDRLEAHNNFKDALVQQFNVIYGTDEADIESWRGLSRALNFDSIPDSAREAKKMFQGLFVNLVDLVDRDATGQDVTQFESLDELREYTIEHRKYFPKESAYAGGVLKFLLREITGRHYGGSNGPGVRSHVRERKYGPRGGR